jgi:mRNA (guanine-N7-)-methyltransferase
MLIDYAVGKGGDISKWKQAKLKFVFGIDVSKDNIYNQNDGVCARYLNERKQSRELFDAIFLPGDSKLNIKDGTAFFKDNERAIAKAILSSSSSKDKLGKAVTRNAGIGSRGFNVSSCQFAIHYMFENETVLHSFLRNVSECTKVNGYFIGTCYDGQTVFKKLGNRENYSIYIDGKMIFDIQKKYKQTGFSDDETSVGYPISVYQESINKYSTEFLVNFVYLSRLMEDYGFKLIREVRLHRYEPI